MVQRVGNPLLALKAPQDLGILRLPGREAHQGLRISATKDASREVEVMTVQAHRPRSGKLLEARPAEFVEDERTLADHAEPPVKGMDLRGIPEGGLALDPVLLAHGLQVF